MLSLAVTRPHFIYDTLVNFVICFLHHLAPLLYELLFIRFNCVAFLTELVHHILYILTFCYYNFKGLKYCQEC